MKLYLTSFLFLILFSTCQSQDNTLPMYGETEKSKKYIEIDNEFIEQCLKQFGSIDSSVKVQIDNAWRYFYHNDLETAMKRFNQAWLLNPEYPDSYFGFASLMEMRGKSKQAERFYQLGKDKDSANTSALICFQRIADCKEHLKDIEGAIKAYEKITMLNPANSFVFKKIGYLHMELKNSTKAFEAYNKAIELDPEDAITFNNRAYLYQTLKNYEMAIDDYSNAIELNPKYISALVNRGIAQMQINKFQEAKIDFERCIALDPNSGELRRHLGLAKLKLNELSGACDDFELASKKGDAISIKLLEENCLK